MIVDENRYAIFDLPEGIKCIFDIIFGFLGSECILYLFFAIKFGRILRPGGKTLTRRTRRVAAFWQLAKSLPGVKTK